MQGEVAWVLPEGIKTYYRGFMTLASYEFAGPLGKKLKPWSAFNKSLKLYTKSVLYCSRKRFFCTFPMVLRGSSATT